MKTYPKIKTVILEDPKKTYSVDIPQQAAEFSLKARFNNEFQLSYEPDGEFIVIQSVKTVSGLQLPKNLTIYLKSPAKGEVIEIETWN